MPATIVSSEIIEDSVQKRGRRKVRERHVDSVGFVHLYSYTAEATDDADAILAARAAWLPGWLEEQELLANQQEIAP